MTTRTAIGTRRVGAWGEWWIALGVLLILMVLPYVVPAAMVIDFVIRLAAFGILATSLNLLIGYGGMISFGHALFFSGGAYSFGVMMQRFALPIPVAITLSLLFCSVLGLVVGALCVRLREIYFAILTLAFSMLMYSVIESWSSVTGGDQGLMGGIPKPPFFGINLGSRQQLYWFAAIVGVACILALRRIVYSPFGYTLRMVRDNPNRAQFLGINVYRVRLTAFVVAGFFGGIAGIIMALFMSGAYPDMAYWTTSGEAIFMIMIGGMEAFFGPLVGAIFLLLFNDLVVRYTELDKLVLGSIILFIALSFRRGLLGMVFKR